MISRFNGVEIYIEVTEHKNKLLSGLRKLITKCYWVLSHGMEDSYPTVTSFPYTTVIAHWSHRNNRRHRHARRTQINTTYDERHKKTKKQY